MSDKKIICNLLKKAKKPSLSSILERAWGLPLFEYAKNLWQFPSSIPVMERELEEAFEREFLRIGMNLENAKVFLNKLDKTRVIQTATHLTASEGPTFLALHCLALLGMPPQETYFVGTYSGVSFSNSAWSGCLNYSDRFILEDIISSQYKGFSDLKRSENDRSRDSSEKRISLIPGSMRNKLVFNSKVPEKLVNQTPFFSDPIQKLMPPTEEGGDYSIWATRFCTNQLRYITKNRSILYFDINEVIKSYLIKVLENSDHPLHIIFFNSRIREKVLGSFPPDMPLFIHELCIKNKFRQESIFLKNGFLVGKNYKLELTLEKIVSELEKGILCPSLFLVFTSLSFLNGFTCFGSFKQVEYLNDFKIRWLKNDFLDKKIVSSVNVDALTSGLCIDGNSKLIFPLDIVLGFDWEFDEYLTMGNFIKPLLPRIGIRI